MIQWYNKTNATYTVVGKSLILWSPEFNEESIFLKKKKNFKFMPVLDS